MMLDKKVTNDKPLDLSMTKSVVTMLFTAALMFFLFRSLANSTKQTAVLLLVLVVSLSQLSSTFAMTLPSPTLEKSITEDI